MSMRQRSMLELWYNQYNPLASMQMSEILQYLQSMQRRQENMQLDIAGDLALAGRLTAASLAGSKDGLQAPAVVYISEAATISGGAHVIRTWVGTQSHGRTRDEHYVYVPYLKQNGRPEACVMAVSFLLLIRKEGMGWPNDEARIALGELYTDLQVRVGAGLETTYNDDPAEGSVCVPRVLFANPKKLNSRYPWAVHLRQINCPLCHFSQTIGKSWITVSKMGFHGKRDYHLRDGPAPE